MRILKYIFISLLLAVLASQLSAYLIPYPYCIVIAFLLGMIIGAISLIVFTVRSK